MVVICIIVRRVRKLLRFPWTNPGESRVYLGLLDIVSTNKTVERFDETMAEEVAVLCYELWLDSARGGSEFWGLAEHTSQSIGGKQLILAMFRIEDIVDCVACAAKTRPGNRDSEKRLGNRDSEKETRKPAGLGTARRRLARGERRKRQA